MHLKETFSKRLRQAAIAKYGKEHGIVSYVARDVGSSIQASSNWLHAKALPRAKTRSMLAEKLCVSAQWLVGADQEKHDGSLETAVEALRIILPLAATLNPNEEAGLVDELYRYAYSELQAGSGKDEVAYRVSKRLEHSM